MNILDRIIDTKRKEVFERKQLQPISKLESSPYFSREVYSMRESLTRGIPVPIIAEFKRRSPSKGNIFNEAEVGPVVRSYAEAGCAGISVLTDEIYFGGSLNDLLVARQTVEVPLLRKEFVIDQFQIVEAKSYGADLILLIAEVLSEAEVLDLAKFARSLGMEVLLEMHSSDQVHKINEYVQIVGINNRNLKTFEVDIDASIRLLHSLHGDFLKISESGLNEAQTVMKLYNAGFQGFLIGENFMKSHKPGQAYTKFVTDIRNLQEMAL